MSIETREVSLPTNIPIDISTPKPYLFAHTLLNADHYTRTFKIDDQIFVCRVNQKKPLVKELNMLIESDNSITKVYEEELVARIRFELGLDESMNILRKMGKIDRKFRKSLGYFPGFRLFANSNIVEAAVLTLLSQNTKFPDYLAIANNFIEKYGTEVPWDDNLKVFPDANIITSMSVSEWKTDMRAVMQAKYLGNFTADTIEEIETYTFYPIYERGIKGLQKINGVGPYVSRILMVYAARRYNLAPFNQNIRDIMMRRLNIDFETIHQFDTWIKRNYKVDPALIIHTYLLEYFPAYLREYDFNSEYARRYLNK